MRNGWAFAFVLCVCASSATSEPLSREPRPSGADRDAAALAAELRALSPRVRPQEAQRLAEGAYASTRLLQREYKIAWHPLFQNFLVNAGVRERGLCYHWTEDLLERLRVLRLKTLVLRWGVARPGTLREHNCLVVTAAGQPFERGIVLDGWRRGGRLYWTHVARDHYPWREDRSDYARARLKRMAAREASANARIRLPRNGSPNSR
ncbi:MAG TPA: hypothetical protein VF551_01055 [Chthoniobacterales bacterium]|jgi:hypothetical protein